MDHRRSARASVWRWARGDRDAHGRWRAAAAMQGLLYPKLVFERRLSVHLSGSVFAHQPRGEAWPSPLGRRRVSTMIPAQGIALDTRPDSVPGSTIVACYNPVPGDGSRLTMRTSTSPYKGTCIALRFRGSRNAAHRDDGVVPSAVEAGGLVFGDQRPVHAVLRLEPLEI